MFIFLGYYQQLSMILQTFLTMLYLGYHIILIIINNINICSCYFSRQYDGMFHRKREPSFVDTKECHAK